MKLVVCFFVGLAVAASSCCAQESTIEELSELISSASEVAGTGWRIAYAYDTRTVTMISKSTIRGTEEGDFGFPDGDENVAEYPIRISFKLTLKPTEKRVQALKSLTQQKSDFRDGMSLRARGWAGLAKFKPKLMTQGEWAEYLEYTELQRQIESLAMPTHTYNSLHLIDLSEWHIRPATDQSKSGKRLLAQYDQLRKLMVPYEGQPNLNTEKAE